MPRMTLLLAMGLWATSVRAQTLTLSLENTDSVISRVGTHVVREAFRRAGLGVRFRRLPLQRAIEEANDGSTDGDLDRIADVTATYPNLVLVPTPIVTLYVCIYGKSPSILQSSRADIRKMRVAYVRGIMIARSSTQGMTVIETQDQVAAEALLENGRVDIIMMSYVDGELEVAEHGNARSLVRWPHVWSSAPLYLVLNNRRRALVPSIQAASLQMKSKGLIDKYYDETLRDLHIAPLPLNQVKGQ